MDTRKDILWRVHLCFLGILLLGTGIIARVVYIQNVQGDYWENLSQKQHLKYIKTDAERGTIYSEDGNMLSTSIPIFDIYIDFAAEGLRQKNGKRFYDNLDSLSLNLAQLFNDGSAAVYKKKLLNGYKKGLRYYSLKKRVAFEDYVKLRDFPLVRQGRNKSGFIIEVRDNRVNPYVLLANRTIGLSRGDTSKNVGLERSYDKYLRGQSGQRLVRYAAGAYIPVDGAEIAPENGKDIITTIDTRIQDIAENALLDMMENNKSIHGTAIVMEVKTGKIKAIANLGKLDDGQYWEDYNYGLGWRSEPGSVFKLTTLLSLLEDKYVDTNSIVDCEGGVKSFYGLTIRDSHKGTGRITVKEAFAMSSNVAFAKMADQYYHTQPQKYVDHLKHLRLNQSSGIDIFGTAKPFIKEPTSKYWTKTTIPFMAHGYEELVTPLQIMMVYNAVANGGKMMKPYLVNEVMERGEVVEQFKPVVLVDEVASPENIGKLKACLLEVVESRHGTARALKTDSYQFGGKTGTAVTAMDNRGYNKGSKIYQSAFIGFFPYDQPEYTVAVVIQNSRESRFVYGGSVAGPVFREIADKIYAGMINSIPVTQYANRVNTEFYKLNGTAEDLKNLLTGLRYKVEEKENAGWSYAYVQDGRSEVMKDSSFSRSAVVPDVRGLGLKDAVYILENVGLKVNINGVGKVQTQSIAASTKLKKGETIKIGLN